MVEFDPVGTISFFRERHRVEAGTTGAVLHALPAHGLTFKPHPRSSTAGAVAWTIVRCLHICNQLMKAKAAEVPQQPHPEHRALLAAFETESSRLSERLATLSQQEWMEERSVTSGDQLLLRQPLGQIFWLFHVDAIHHRGQLSTFLRELGAKVPSIYGPSGDSQR